MTKTSALINEFLTSSDPAARRHTEAELVELATYLEWCAINAIYDSDEDRERAAGEAKRIRRFLIQFAWLVL